MVEKYHMLKSHAVYYEKLREKNLTLKQSVSVERCDHKNEVYVSIYVYLCASYF